MEKKIICEEGEEPNLKMMAFKPQLSFDGVAIMVACATCLIWFGSLSATVRQHSESIKALEAITATLSSTEQAQAANIAVIQTILNERLRPDRLSMPANGNSH